MEDSVLAVVTEDAAADDISGKKGKEGSDEEVAEDGESEGEKEEEEEDEAQLQVEVAELGGEEEAGGEEDEEGQERDQQDNAEDSDDEPVEDDRKYVQLVVQCNLRITTALGGGWGVALALVESLVVVVFSDVLNISPWEPFHTSGPV